MSSSTAGVSVATKWVLRVAMHCCRTSAQQAHQHWVTLPQIRHAPITPTTPTSYQPAQLSPAHAPRDVVGRVQRVHHRQAVAAVAGLPAKALGHLFVARAAARARDADLLVGEGSAVEAEEVNEQHAEVLVERARCRHRPLACARALRLEQCAVCGKGVCKAGQQAGRRRALSRLCWKASLARAGKTRIACIPFCAGL